MQWRVLGSISPTSRRILRPLGICSWGPCTCWEICEDSWGECNRHTYLFLKREWQDRDWQIEYLRPVAEEEFGDRRFIVSERVSLDCKTKCGKYHHTGQSPVKGVRLRVILAFHNQTYVLENVRPMPVALRVPALSWMASTHRCSCTLTFLFTARILYLD